MLISQKNIFWEAAVITLFIFGLGILLGIFIENSRGDKISDLYLISEVNLLDVQIQTEILNLDYADCQEIVEKNIEFADKVYNDAKVLERYEGASRFKDLLVQQHKRYDLLRTLLWINSIKIKEKCGNSLHTLVYLYDYQIDDLQEKSKQEVFSRFLEELKRDSGDTIILIPIAKNLNITKKNGFI